MITILTDEAKKDILSLPEVEWIGTQTLTIHLKEKPSPEFVAKIKEKLVDIRFNLVYNGQVEQH